MHQFKNFCSLSLLSVVFLTGCGECNDKGGYIRNEALYSLAPSYSLQDAEDLLQPNSLEGNFFCLSIKDATVVYEIERSPIEQPCFQFMPRQGYVGQFKYDPTQHPIINADKFYFYYKSIPKELNKFLVIKAQRHNDLLRGSGVVWPTPSSRHELWWGSNYEPIYSPYRGYDYYHDTGTASLKGILHSTVLAEHDSFIYIYLPLNIAIKTPAYAGVLPPKSVYQLEINNLANPALRLTDDFSTTLYLRSYGADLGYCTTYASLNFSMTIKPEDIKPTLLAYKSMVENYRLHPNPLDATFPNPYAKP